jgi:hypothetical protein
VGPIDKAYGSASEALSTAQRNDAQLARCATLIVVGGDRSKAGRLCVARAGHASDASALEAVASVSSSAVRTLCCRSPTTLKRAVVDGLLHQSTADYLIEHRLYQTLHEASLRGETKKKSKFKNRK